MTSLRHRQAKARTKKKGKGKGKGKETAYRERTAAEITLEPAQIYISPVFLRPIFKKYDTSDVGCVPTAKLGERHFRYKTALVPRRACV